jgi:hypothetical protein
LPSLALDFLNVKVDTNQVLGIEDFVAASAKHSFSTPLTTAYRFRDAELDQP